MGNIFKASRGAIYGDVFASAFLQGSLNCNWRLQEVFASPMQFPAAEVRRRASALVVCQRSTGDRFLAIENKGFWISNNSESPLKILICILNRLREGPDDCTYLIWLEVGADGQT